MVALALGLGLLLVSAGGLVGLTVLALEVSGVLIAIATAIVLLNLLAVVFGLAARRRRRRAQQPPPSSDPAPPIARRTGRITAGPPRQDPAPSSPETDPAEIRIADRR
jgi:membrane protein implicated in regulation of membrane protease activity